MASENEARDRDVSNLKRATAFLGEHFDAVQILVSRNDAGQTTTAQWGCGDWNARVGMAHKFMVEQDEEMRVGIRQTDE